MKKKIQKQKQEVWKIGKGRKDRIADGWQVLYRTTVARGELILFNLENAIFMYDVSQESFELLMSNVYTDWRDFFSTRREFLREILYKNIAIIAIQHGNFILFTPLAIFPILLGEIHSSPSGKFPYTY